MEILDISKAKRHREIPKPEISKQTGFPSPATHYLEPTINLHKVLVTNCDATFFVRIDGDGYKNQNILHQDVLIVDRSLKPRPNDLVLAMVSNEFKILRLNDQKLDATIDLWGVITYIIHSAR